MIILLYVFYVSVCLFLIAVVLLQSGKGSDLAGAFGGGGSQSAMGARGATTALSRLTTYSAVLFMVLSLVLAIVNSRDVSVMDKAAPATPAATPEATPAATPAATPGAEATNPSADEGRSEGPESTEPPAGTESEPASASESLGASGGEAVSLDGPKPATTKPEGQGPAEAPTPSSVP